MTDRFRLRLGLGWGQLDEGFASEVFGFFPAAGGRQRRLSRTAGAQIVAVHMLYQSIICIPFDAQHEVNRECVGSKQLLGEVDCIMAHAKQCPSTKDF